MFGSVMAHEYADLLSDYDDKGVLGAPEFQDDEATVLKKTASLAAWWRESKFCLVITGAGISTAAGIADFRGPNGIWTTQGRRARVRSSPTTSPSSPAPTEEPKASGSFEDARPTFTHESLRLLETRGRLQYLISQNVDGLHSRFGFPLDRLSEVHGNVFQLRCNKCGRVEFNAQPLKSVGRKPVGRSCLDLAKPRNRCTGQFCDFLLDWEDELPEPEFERALKAAQLADLVVCLGTSLQIEPVGSMPLKCKRKGGKVVTVNLQHTALEKKADLAIHAPVDRVLGLVLEQLGLPAPPSTAQVELVLHSAHGPLQASRKRRKSPNCK